MNRYEQLKRQLAGEPHTWLVTGVAGFTSLNDLFELLRSSLVGRFGHLRDFAPVYQAYRAGDVRHSLADIGKARTLLGYEPSHNIGDGLREALEWYVADLR
jgi:UDP-N-acetylglucosamine 4-epimerase